MNTNPSCFVASLAVVAIAGCVAPTQSSSELLGMPPPEQPSSETESPPSSWPPAEEPPPPEPPDPWPFVGEAFEAPTEVELPHGSTTPLDWNGDGVTDLLAASIGNAMGGYMEFMLVYPGNSDGLGLEPIELAGSLSATEVRGGLLGDVDGDGYDDVYYSSSQYGSNYCSEDSNTTMIYGGPEPRSVEHWRGTWGAMNLNRLGDVDGDGYDDVGPSWRSVWFGDAGGLTEDGEFHTLDAAVGCVPVGDLDGNGTADLASSSGHWFSLAGREEQVREAPGLADAYWIWPAGDVDGDGRAEVLAVRQPIDGVNQPLELYDDPADADPVWSRSLPGSYWYRLEVRHGDVNADGFGDLVLWTASLLDPGVQVFLGSPEGLSAVPTARLPQPFGFYPPQEADRSGLLRALADVDGDGAADLLLSSDVTSWFSAARFLYGGRTCPGDADCDGVPDIDDCGPLSSLQHKKLLEVCDGVDNDCNGEVDEGFDADGDGFAPCVGDCDDEDDSRYPGAPDATQDGSDRDCDGEDW